MRVGSRGVAIRSLPSPLSTVFEVPPLRWSVAYWGIGIPLGWWLGLHGRWGAPGVWMGLIGGPATAAILLLLRFDVLSRRLPARRAEMAPT
ncbi:MAG: hypothetical protein ACREFJ_05985 [Acetobacteraceae bacterium]